MTLSTRILAVLVAVLATIGLGEFFVIQRAVHKAASAESALQAAAAENNTLRADLRSTKASLAARNAALTAARKAAEAQQQKLDHELQANPAWAGAAVPDAVWDSLRPGGQGGAAAPAR